MKAAAAGPSIARWSKLPVAVNGARDGFEVKLRETRERIARLVRRLENEEDAPRALVQRLSTRAR